LAFDNLKLLTLSRLLLWTRWQIITSGSLTGFLSGKHYNR
jgi:hypothetical protein